ncbi:MAG: hypothetical protein QOE23_2123 [Pseudonocardiales bacterium]|jgi:hypothetical protein|nr:hypothetical protein [Pseudonocardiales bacterium]
MRFVVGLEEGTDRELVAENLQDAGARTVTSLAPTMPDVMMVEFEDDAEPEQGRLMARLAAMPGVRYAEPDVLQTGF